MSFILDALRKSDAERQRSATPGLADVRYTTPRTRRSVWVPLLVVVLLANAVFMGVQWLRRPGPVSPAVPAAEAPIAVAAGPPPAVRPLARESEPAEAMQEPLTDTEPMEPPVVAELAEPGAARPATSTVTAAVAVPGTGPPATASTQLPPAAARIATASPANPTPRISESTELPSAEQLIAAGTLRVPLLNLDFHFYSDKPAARFVQINTRKYKEGTQLAEGPTVESITPDGVILNSQGTRFVLRK